jgi:hypothetical protein
MKVISRASIVVAVVTISAVAWVAIALYNAGYTTNVNKPVIQKIPFSHLHHAGELGINCEYCHTSVETSSFAGIPPTNTCMTCHSQIWTSSPMLEPVRNSFRTNKPLQWIRVNDLPDFVYFNHSIHIAKGVGCVTCHGRVDEMPLTWKKNTLFMSWCIDCHKDPARYIRPQKEIFNFTYRPVGDQLAVGRKLVKQYNIQVKRLTDCSVCHR